MHAHRITDASSLLFSDKKTHLVTLGTFVFMEMISYITLFLCIATVIKPDNTFVVSVDQKQVLAGILGASDKFEPVLKVFRLLPFTYTYHECKGFKPT